MLPSLHRFLGWMFVRTQQTHSMLQTTVFWSLDQIEITLTVPVLFSNAHPLWSTWRALSSLWVVCRCPWMCEPLILCTLLRPLDNREWLPALLGRRFSTVFPYSRLCTIIHIFLNCCASPVFLLRLLSFLLLLSVCLRTWTSQVCFLILCAQFPSPHGPPTEPN